ncbi:MAG TPA: FkbM family methyltransferase [Solirubrobacteraceae bacterium]|nr:FkbM family methyltransferase [Solirubrobacteraceae bacterium]
MLQYASRELRLIGSGTRWRDRASLVEMSARLHLAARGQILPGHTREFDLQLQGLALRVRADDFVLFEVLGFGGYDIDFAPLGSVATVLDVGANVGLASLYLASKFRDATFFCVEPSGPSHALLVENLQRNAIRARAVRAAATAEPTRVTVAEGRHPGLTRVSQNAGTAGDHVAGLTIDALLDAGGFARADLMKLDIEGGEQQLLEVASSWQERVGAILMEVHAPLTVEAATRQLAPFGYRPLRRRNEAEFADLLFVSR